MSATPKLLPFLAFAIALGACSESGTDTPGTPLGAALASPTASVRGVAPFGPHVREACPYDERPGMAQCSALLRIDTLGKPSQGYGPADLQSAYDLSVGSRGTGQVVAVVDAYDDPKAESDLAVYRQAFRLPPCTTANGCFRKVNQQGQAASFPPGDIGWSANTSAALDVVSAGCPRCSILLVESNTNAISDLGKSVEEALALGAAVVENSYGGHFGADERRYYDHRGAVIVAGAGNASAVPEEPATYPSVVAVGGTSLRRNATKHTWTESAFGSGGCSRFPKPKWQHDTFCTTRTTNDVAAVADPRTGVAVYDSYGFSGFFEAGGTTVSSALVASVYGLAGNTTKLSGAESLYQHRKSLRDIPPRGFDQLTGLGAPTGIGAF